MTNTPLVMEIKMINVKFNKIIVVLSFVALSGNQIGAEDLKDIYQLALINDPTFKAAEALFRAGKEYKVQGRAGLMPSLSISGSTAWNEYRLEESLLDEYNSNSYSGTLQQPVFRLDRWFQFRQGKALSESAAADFAYQQQETMIRVATSYFSVLNAKDSLSAAEAEVEAIGRQRDQARKRFDVARTATLHRPEPSHPCRREVLSISICRAALMD